jgi:hypothetical protein
MTLAIAHAEGDKAILDCVREVKPPFQPSAVVDRFAEVLKQYDIRSVGIDRYGAGWVREQFLLKGIGCVYSERSASELYVELVPLVNSGRAELLDNQKLIAQLGNLERRTSRSGKDTVDHPSGGHDDLANAVAGCLVKVASRNRREIGIVGVPLNENSSPFREQRYLSDGTPTWSNDREISIILRQQPPPKQEIS